MNEHDDEEQALKHWSHRLAHAFQILDLEADDELILRLAEVSATSVSPSAGPISAFYVGYAAALAVTSGHVESQTAVRSAVERALKLCEGGKGAGPEGAGWVGTGQ